MQSTNFISDSLEESTIGSFSSNESSDSIEEFGSVDSGISINATANESADPIKAISGSIDPRIKLLSYSSLLTLHACPRKFQLNKLRATKATATEEQGITFAFGHIVGEGIQLVLAGASMSDILFKLFLMWDVPLIARNDKDKKSFAEGILAIRKFIELRKAGFLEDLELIYIEKAESDGSFSKTPACELGFAVSVFDNFTCRGFVDAVLRNRLTGEIIILEVKTTKNAKANPAKYKNSGQALGYSVVLDALFPGLSSYSVLYLEYSTTELSFTPLPFPKSFESRAEWIRSLVFDVEDIVRYEEAGIYPRRGESCFSFFRECEYINSCGFSTSYLAKPLEESAEEMEIAEARYTHKFNLIDLINFQIARNSLIISTVETTGEST